MLLRNLSCGYLNTPITHLYSSPSHSTFLISFISKHSLFLLELFSVPHPQAIPWASWFHCLCSKPPGHIHWAGGEGEQLSWNPCCLSCQSPLESHTMQLHSPFVICSAFAFQPLPRSLYPHPTVSAQTPQVSEVSGLLDCAQDPICQLCHEAQFVLVMLTLATKRPWALLPTSSPHITVFGSGSCCLSLAACLPHTVCATDLLIFCGT